MISKTIIVLSIESEEIAKISFHSFEVVHSKLVLENTLILKHSLLNTIMAKTILNKSFKLAWD